ncbi:F0F1 ATP synthase subunit A [uncultured Agrococcus sp.]|uniref:F0F1 ATP synthase subunit A n=1 Tax=uncultured Agrococcus sp. TaxID=382258 RepID=UPI0025DAC8A6|nr:F0F1 ATP synthase subunit A [uncultured Agrococcus sp.]
MEWLGSDEPIFGINRVVMLRLISLAVLVLVFWLGTRRLRLIPTRGQSVVELGLGFVRNNIAYEMLGEKDGKRFLPLLTTIFFVVLFCNITGVVPLLNLGSTSVIGLPLVLAIAAYVAFIYAGLKKHPGAFLKNSLFPSGVPWPLYILLTPIEFISTFVIRPITLTLRLMMNMFVGHMMLVLLFSATHFFLLGAPWAMKAIGVGTLGAAFAFTLFEVMVSVLQAYIFAVLTAVYIQLALAEEH